MPTNASRYNADMTTITDQELVDLEADARRSKNRPDRRRRQTIRAVERIRRADALIANLAKGNPVIAPAIIEEYRAYLADKFAVPAQPEANRPQPNHTAVREAFRHR